MKKSKLNSMTKDLFNEPIKDFDLLQEPIAGKLIYQGRVLTLSEKDNIISQAKLIKSIELFGMLTNEMKYLCEKKIYLDSKDHFDIATGKMGLWFIDVLKKKLDRLSTMK